jgi:UDP-N-acetylmuramyl tripeptide synthase
VLRGMDGTDVTVRLPDGERFEVSFPLPGLYNVYNALGAAAAATALGVSSSDIRESLSRAAAVFGRVERLRVNDRDVAILLVKNPAGANEVLRTLTLEDGEIDLWVALNDRIADGRDVSWVWDADFELLAPRVRRVTCAGTRAEEMALRLKYAGVDTSAIAVEREAGLGGSLDKAIADRGSNGAPLFALPTYTALIELRDDLADRGVAGKWSD